MTDQVIGPLLPTWETWIELLAPGFCLISLGCCMGEPTAEKISSLSYPTTPPFK